MVKGFFPYFGPTGTPVLDFWWRLLWVSNGFFMFTSVNVIIFLKIWSMIFISKLISYFIISLTCLQNVRTTTKKNLLSRAWCGPIFGMSYFGATSIHDLDFWWRLLWVSNLGWVLSYFCLFCRSECNVHSPRSTSGWVIALLNPSPTSANACGEVTGCAADHQKVSKCSTRGGSLGMYITLVSTKKPQKIQNRCTTLRAKWALYQ